jgi:hypothetical protein
LAVSGSPLAFVDESNIDQLVEVVVEIMRFHIDGGLEIGGTEFVVRDERAQNPKPRHVADRLLHRKIFFERQPAIFGQRWVWLSNLRR